MSVLFERDTTIGRMGATITAITPDAAGVVILYKE